MWAFSDFESGKRCFPDQRSAVENFAITPMQTEAFLAKNRDTSHRTEEYEKKQKWSHTEGDDIDIVFTVGFRKQHTVRTSDAIAF